MEYLIGTFSDFFMVTLAYAENGVQDSPAGPSVMGILPPLLMMLAIFYLLLIRPQQKKQKDREAMLDGLKEGDNVITNGGIYGNISKIKDKVVILKIAEKVKIKIDKSALSGIKGDTPS